MQSAIGMDVRNDVFGETIQHLFIECPFAKIIWRIVYATYNISPPANITNMFGNWLNGIDNKTKARIRIGVSALCWAIWICRNNVVFNKTGVFHFLQVINMVVHWIRLWAHLLPVDQRELMDIGCNRLVMVAHDFFNRGG